MSTPPTRSFKAPRDAVPGSDRAPSGSSCSAPRPRRGPDESANILHSCEAARHPGTGDRAHVGSPLFTPAQDHVAVQPATRANAVGGPAAPGDFIDIALD